MPFVYILYNYGEYGAEDVMATLDRRHLPGMLERSGKADSDDLKALNTLLRRPEEELAYGWKEHVFLNEPLQHVHEDGRHNLSNGWGGWVLQVTELYQSKTVTFPPAAHDNEGNSD